MDSLWGVRGWTFPEEMTNPPPLRNPLLSYSVAGITALDDYGWLGPDVNRDLIFEADFESRKTSKKQDNRALYSFSSRDFGRLLRVRRVFGRKGSFGYVGPRSGMDDPPLRSGQGGSVARYRCRAKPLAPCTQMKHEEARS